MQFNWIFVLIVGALIMAFFFMVIKNQIKTSEFETQVNVQTKLSTLMKNAKQTPGSLFEINFKNARLNIDSCGQGFYLNGDRNLRIQLETVFSPDLIQSKKNNILLWTLPWEVPFHITNIVYLTNQDILYYIIGDETGLAYQIYDSPQYTSLPDEMNKKFMSYTAFDRYVNSPTLYQLPDTNNYKVRFVIIGDRGYKTIPNMGITGDVSAVHIKPREGGLDGIGYVHFYEKQTDGSLLNATSRSYYLLRPLLFGALFSENKELYECVVKKSFEKMRVVVDVYWQRTSELNGYYGRDTEKGDCSVLVYSEAEETLEGMYDIVVGGVFSTPDTYFFNLYKHSLDPVVGVKGLNHIAQLKSCPTIY